MQRNNPPGYQVYLLRLWQSERGGRIIWMASLEDARIGTRHGFTSLEALTEFLKERLRHASRASKDLTGVDDRQI